MTQTVNEITPEVIKNALPPQLRKTVSDDMVATLNRLITDPIEREHYRENLVSYTSVLKDGRFKTQQYFDAVRYVSCKLMGLSNQQAYLKTFPERHQRFLDQNYSDKQISAYVATYNKTKLVNLIYEQTLIPTHILNADLYQQALNAQAKLMLTAKSEKVRSDAANSILTHLKAPEIKKIELDVTQKEDSAISELRQATLALAAQQRQLIQAGTLNAQQVASSRIIQGELAE